MDDQPIRSSIAKPDDSRIVIKQNSKCANGPRRAVDDSQIDSRSIATTADIPTAGVRIGAPGKGEGRASAAVASSNDQSVDPRLSSRPRDGSSGIDLPSSFLSRPGEVPRPLFQHSNPSDMLVPRPAALRNSTPRTSTGHLALAIFDNILKNPTDPSIVRFHEVTGDIVAATPSMLIAHITSPSFLDYELLSDFFLTYRGFMLASDLVTFLLARLRWAVDRLDDFGRIVRVRTFVALRHWTLNYFSDDFVPDIALRVQLCDLVNGLYHDLQRRADGGAGDIKIIGELKKCWRRTCGLYWSTARQVHAPEDDIFPGGRPESISLMSESEIPQQLEREREHLQAAAQIIVETRPQNTNVGTRQGARPTIKSIAYSDTSPNPDQLSPKSHKSIHVISCSIPFKPIYKLGKSAAEPLVRHPVPVIVQPAEKSAASYPISKQKRPPSIVDAVRGERKSSHQPPTKAQEEVTEDDMIPPGALVHGSLYQPASPYFDFKEVQAKTSKFNLSFTRPSDNGSGSPLRSPLQTEGSKRLLGSIRRAFNNVNGTHNHPDGFLLSETKASRSDLDLYQTVAAPSIQVRIDLLCSFASERFSIAVEQAQQEEAATHGDRIASVEDPTFAQHLSALKTPAGSRYQINRSVTVGSRSIVIVDDTNSEEPVMSGGLRPPSSIEKALQSSPIVESTLSRDRRDRQAASVAGPSVHRPKELKSDKTVRRTVATPSTLSNSKAVAKGVYIPTGYKSQEKEDPTTPKAAPVSPTRHVITNSMTSTSAGTLRRLASYQSNTTPDKKNLPQRTISKSSDNNPVTSIYHTPTQKLRRRPGGDLKGVSKVHDLEKKLPRRHSFGSISTMSKGQHASLFYDEAHGDKRPVSPLQTDDGTSHRSSATPVRRRGKSISLIQTHSSQPNLRPSFEAEVAKLKALPDDEDDGGVESTLLKLEGKYEKRSPSIASPLTPTGERVSTIEDLAQPAGEQPDEEEKHRNHREHVEEVHPEHTLEKTVEEKDATANLGDNAKRVTPMERFESQSRSIYHMSASTSKSMKRTPPPATRGHKPNKSVAESTASYSSIPLLQRRQRDMDRSPGDRFQHDNVPSAEALLRHAESINSSVDQPRTPKASQPEPGRKRRMEPITSFLLDDTQSLSDEDVLTGPAKTESDARSLLDEPESPPVPRRSRKITAPQALDLGRLTPRANAPVSPIRASTTFNQGLPTPTMSPTVNAHTLTKLEPPVDRQRTPSPHQFINEKGQLTPRQSVLPAHLPFILAYDAEVIAQQFTLVEKDALDELDWREMIDLRWNQAPLPVTDWVSYLRSSEAWGVGLVIARFNLMVKWVLSEILLTESPQERSRAIVQFIKIAAASRRIRNYATMYQITVALLSVDCVGLKRTWALVPASAVTTLRDLERIVQPLRNFHNLRVEMETAPPGAGCIPFIGIYTRDLVYNAQKSAIVTSPPQNEFEPLVNFERHHTAATVVKTLLRLLEQSGMYKITRNAEVLSRCLWIAALEEDDIRFRCERVD